MLERRYPDVVADNGAVCSRRADRGERQPAVVRLRFLEERAAAQPVDGERRDERLGLAELEQPAAEGAKPGQRTVEAESRADRPRPVPRAAVEREHDRLRPDETRRDAQPERGLLEA